MRLGDLGAGRSGRWVVLGSWCAVPAVVCAVVADHSPGFAALTGALAGLCGWAVWLGWRRWLRPLGTWTSVACLGVLFATVLVALALVLPTCPGRIGEPGACSTPEVAMFALLGVATPVAVAVAVSPVVWPALWVLRRLRCAASVRTQMSQRSQQRAAARSKNPARRAHAGRRP